MSYGLKAKKSQFLWVLIHRFKEFEQINKENGLKVTLEASKPFLDGLNRFLAVFLP